jgi:hypothetical protein
MYPPLAGGDFLVVGGIEVLLITEGISTQVVDHLYAVSRREVVSTETITSMRQWQTEINKTTFLFHMVPSISL